VRLRSWHRSITDLAELFTISRPTVYRTLQTKTRPTTDVLLNI